MPYKVNTVAIKVPQFFKHAPETWFVHLEAQFDLKQLKTSSTKFYHCISALPSEVATQWTHMKRNPGEDHYPEIKDRLIHLYSLSNYQKFKALINLPFTSDTTPSVLMSSMLNLYPKKFKPDFVFIGLFLRRLPQSIRDHLLALDLDENPDALAKKADRSTIPEWAEQFNHYRHWMKSQIIKTKLIMLIIIIIINYILLIILTIIKIIIIN